MSVPPRSPWAAEEAWQRHECKERDVSEWTQISPDPAEPEAGRVGGAGCWAGLCVEVSPGRLGPCTGRGAPDALDGQPPPSSPWPHCGCSSEFQGLFL